MLTDLHLHSKYSWDSNVEIIDYIQKAEQLGFDAIAITDHNSIESHSEIDKLQDQTSVLLIPGQEVSTADGHLLVYGWMDLIPAALSMVESVTIAHQSNGMCIAAHPFDPFRSGSYSKIFETGIDGFEVINASAWFGFPNWLARRAWKDSDLIGLGNSDSHRLEEFGTAFSELPEFHDLPSFYSVLSGAEPRGKRIGILRKLNRLIRRKLR